MQIKKITDINGRTTYKVDHAEILFRNFAGAEGRYNAKGKRNFNLKLDNDSAKMLEEDGFNVRYLQPREEGDEPLPILKVNVNMESNRPPLVEYKNDHGIKKLDENTIIKLDDADFKELHIEFSPYHREDTTTAWANKIQAVVEEDEFESRFYDVPDSSANTMTFARVNKHEDE